MNMIFTTVGLDEVATLIAGGSAVQITELAIGTSSWTPDETASALQTELKRLSLTGDKTSSANVHLTAVDSSTDEYTVFEAGIYLASGTLLAITGDGAAITGKASRTDAVYAIDLPLAEFADANVVIGGTGFMLPQSTESVAGLTRYATTEEAEDGTVDNKSVTPEGVKAAFDNRTATTEEAIAGTIDNKSVTPEGVKAALDNRNATKESTGLVELATLDEALNKSEDQRVITPESLDYVLSQPRWVWTSAVELGSPFQIQTNSGAVVNYISQISMMGESAFVTSGSIQRFEYDGSAWAKVGTGFDYPNGDNPTVTALSNTDIAVIRSDADVLNTLRWNGSTWTEVGNALPISAVLSEKSIVALSSNTVAIVNDNRNDLGFYEFDGTDWFQVGNRLTLSFSNQNVYRSKISALTSNRIAFASSNNVLVAYEFDGTDWMQVGNITSIPTNYNCGIAALNSTDIVIVNNGSDDLRVYRFDGTDWLQQGRSLSVDVGDNGQSVAVMAISGSEVLVFLTQDDMLHHYEIKHAPALPPSPAFGSL